jgi:hypothetical protein
MIESYSFGNITVDGKSFRSDIIVYPEITSGDWWRKKGHELCSEDIKEILDYGPEVLIIGTGKFGLMKVGESTIKHIRERGIKLIVQRTSEAVKIYNEVARKKRTVAALHLTC